MNKKLWKYHLLSILVFISISFITTQIIPFLISLGYNTIERGYILASISIMGIISTIIFGYLFDHYKRYKRVFMIGYIILIVGSVVMFNITNHNIYYTLIIIGLVGGLAKCITSLLETWMLFIGKDKYGRLRASGALGLAIASPVAGYIVHIYTYTTLITISVVISFLTILLLFNIKEEKKTNTNKIYIKDIKELITNKRYIILILIFLSIYMIGTADQYVVIDKMLRLGSTTELVGVKFAVQSIMEIPIFIIGSKLLKRFKAIHLLLLGTILYAIKFIGYGYFQTPILIIAVASLQLVTLPLLLLTSKVLINEVTSSKLKATAQMLAMAIYIGISGLITPIITSNLSNNIGYDNTLYIVAGFFIIPLLLIIYYRKLESTCNSNSDALK
ncbi:MAG: MFS transporter [Erysipelotrichaceae bacterium]